MAGDCKAIGQRFLGALAMLLVSATALFARPAPYDFAGTWSGIVDLADPRPVSAHFAATARGKFAGTLVLGADISCRVSIQRHGTTVLLRGRCDDSSRIDLTGVLDRESESITGTLRTRTRRQRVRGAFSLRKQVVGSTTTTSTPTTTMQTTTTTVPQLTSLDLTDPPVTTLIVALQLQGQLGGSLLVNGNGVAVGGNVIVDPTHLAPSLSALSIPAGVTLTLDGFAAIDSVDVEISAASTTMTAVLDGALAFVKDGGGSVGNFNVRGGTVSMTGSLQSDGSLSVFGDSGITLAGYSASSGAFSLESNGPITVTGSVTTNAPTSSALGNLSVIQTAGAVMTILGNLTANGGSIVLNNQNASGSIVLGDGSSSVAISTNVTGASKGTNGQIQIYLGTTPANANGVFDTTVNNIVVTRLSGTNAFAFFGANPNAVSGGTSGGASAAAVNLSSQNVIFNVPTTSNLGSILLNRGVTTTADPVAAGERKRAGERLGNRTMKGHHVQQVHRFQGRFSPPRDSFPIGSSNCS